MWTSRTYPCLSLLQHILLQNTPNGKIWKNKVLQVHNFKTQEKPQSWWFIDQHLNFCPAAIKCRKIREQPFPHFFFSFGVSTDFAGNVTIITLSVMFLSEQLCSDSGAFMFATAGKRLRLFETFAPHFCLHLAEWTVCLHTETSPCCGCGGGMTRVYGVCRCEKSFNRSSGEERERIHWVYMLCHGKWGVKI